MSAMKYTDGIAYDKETMRVLICPKCGNEEFGENAEYCRICGMDLYNRCEGEPVFDPQNGRLIRYEERHKNPSNARYCEVCGKPTLFLKLDLLKDFDKYREP